MEVLSSPILVSGCSVGPWEVAYTADAARTGWNERCFDYLRRFEAEVCRALGVRYAVATPSCTAALHLSLLTLGVGPGDEVILPDSTWVATANAVAYTGAAPVFVDSGSDDWTIDPAGIERAVTPRTKAVIPVHLYGHPCKMDEIHRIAQAHGLYVIEDAAQSMGSEYHGKRTGSLGDMACFSFHGSKVVVMGEGGVLTTNRRDLYERAKFLGDQAKHPTRRFYNEEIGYKFRLSNLQAAFGLAQMERLDEIVEKKRQVYRWYRRELEGLEGVALNPELPGTKNNDWMVTLVLGDSWPHDAAWLLSELEGRGINGRPFFYPITMFPMYQGYQREPAPVARRLHERGLNLPCGAELSREEVHYICAHLRDLLCPGSVTEPPITGWLARREVFLKRKEEFPGVAFREPDFREMCCEIEAGPGEKLTPEEMERLHERLGFRQLFVRRLDSQREACRQLEEAGFVEWQRVPLGLCQKPTGGTELLELDGQPCRRAEDYRITYVWELG